MRVYLVSDSHFNHEKIATYCDRPADFTERIIKNWQQIVRPEDLVIHLGDVFIGRTEGWDKIYPLLPGRKILVRGNHDRQRSLTWWMTHGFDAANDGMIFRNCWLTHEPAANLPEGTIINIHGHLHNIWHGFHPNEGVEAGEETMRLRNELKHPWQRLFAIEYTSYMPVEMQKFADHPDKYQARGKVISAQKIS